MLKNKNKKTLPKKKILIGAAIAIIAVITAIVAIIMANNEEKTKKLKKATDPELARAMTYDQFEDGDENVEGTDYVKFSAFFLRDVNNDGYAEKIKGTCKQIGKEDTLYMEVNVQTEGMLKNGKIEIDGKNFYLVTTAPKDNELKDNYVSKNTKVMEFSDLNNGTQKLLTGVIRSGDYSYSSSTASAIGSNINNLSRDDNKIIFTGTYIGVDNTETEIRKEIELTTDWYGTATASLYASNSTHYDIENRTDEENGTITFDVDIRSQETKELLNINKNYVEGTIPQLNGYDPISVTTTSATTSFNYDETTKKFTLTREATAGEDGKITSSVSRDNYYKITIKYPIAAYETMDSKIVTIEIPVMTYYTGYNNPNKEFVNPYKSNEAKSTLLWTFRGPQEYATRYEITVGEYLTTPTYRYIVSKKKPLKIYNEISEEEKDDTYNVKWYVSKGTNESTDGIVMKETATGAEQVSDQFVKTDSNKESMENLTTNIGVSFVNADKFLAEDGWIKVYDDETGDLLVTFTKNDWNKYTKENPYKFDLPVKHIRVETSETQPSQYFTVYSKKELDDEYITTNYTREQFDELQYIRSQVSIYAGEKLIGTINHTANYEEPYSIAKLALSKNTLSTQVTEKNEKLTISATANESQNQLPWKNGSFLIKMPQDIITTEINNITSTNNNVTITSSEYLENDNGKFIKINTKNTTDAGQTFDIVIDANITPDPRIATQTENFELYAANEDGVDYYYGSSDIYDVNNNLNTTEKVHKSTTSVSLIAPNSLLTNQTASNFDKIGTEVVSPQIADVKPPLATVEQYTEEKTIRIGAQIKNNYASTISEVKILGKIPFEGNTYVISGENLNSTFTTKMTDAGIEVPEELKDKIKVYYSDNENPDRDTNKAENNWKTADQIENWDNVKTYLVDFQDEEIPVGTEYTFYYTVKIPNGLAYNKIAYSHHGVYFALNTPEGKYRTQTEPNKIGIRIAEKYGLEIQKYQANKTNLVPGATYKITKEATDESDEESKTAVTNTEGKLELDNLYAECNYTIEEIKVPENYELNTDTIKFIARVQKDGSLQIEKKEGTTREDITIEKEQNGEETKSKVIVKLEDEAKAKLRITKTEKNTTTPVRGIRFKLTGTGLPESGKNVTTNINGEINIKGLKIGEEYTLEETRATGYYLTSPIKFTITNNDGTYTANITEGETKETTITEEENIPVINMNIENEKIPTYDLEISKIKKVTSVTSGEDGTQQEETTYLQGAKFKLYKGTKELGSYITDENGKITINGLYQYIDGKDEEATYMLKETLAPEGYAKVKDITFKVDGTTGELKFVNTEGKEEKYTTDGTTVKLTIEDSPSFKLIKTDAETGERLTNIKFAIYDVEDGTTPAKNSKGEILGTKETINGKEYYTVTTDSNGELTADLPEGMYKAVEVEAPEKYDISEPYYFGIGASREGKESIVSEDLIGFGNEKDEEIASMAATTDGGYIVAGSFNSEYIDFGNGIRAYSHGDTDGIIIKYDEENKCEWAQSIGGTGSDKVNKIIETQDEGYIIACYSAGNLHIDDETIIEKSGGIIIKYDNNGQLEWYKYFEGYKSINTIMVTTDGKYLVGGQKSSNGVIGLYNEKMELIWEKTIPYSGNYSYAVYDVTETKTGYICVGNLSSIGGSILAKFDFLGNLIYSKSLFYRLSTVCSTKDNGFVVGAGVFTNEIDLGNGVVIKTPTGNVWGTIVKYNENDEAEWYQLVGTSMYSVIQTQDGGYLIGGYNEGVGVYYNNKHYYSKAGGIVARYDSAGKYQWSIGIGEGDRYNTTVKSIIEDCHGNYLYGGYYKEDISVGNSKKIENKGEKDGFIAKFKYEVRGNTNVKILAEVAGEKKENIKKVLATKDGGYIAVGEFYSAEITFENGQKIVNKYASRGKSAIMIIKYNNRNQVEWTSSFNGDDNKSITSVIQTGDGGYVVSGTFYSKVLELNEDMNITNKGNSGGYIIKYNTLGKIEWTKSIGGTSYDSLVDMSGELNDGFIVLVNVRSNTVILDNGDVLEKRNNYNKYIIKVKNDGAIEWEKLISSDTYIGYESLSTFKDGSFIIGVSVLPGKIYYIGENSKEITQDSKSMIVMRFTNKGILKDTQTVNYNISSANLNSIRVNCIDDEKYVVGIGENYSNSILMLCKNNKIEWVREIKNEYISALTVNDNKEILIGGTTSNRIIETENGNEINYYNGSTLRKYDENGDLKKVELLSGNITSIDSISPENYIVAGLYKGRTIDINGKILTNKGEEDGLILNVIDQMGAPEVQKLEVENKRKEFKITTDIQEIDNIKGGSISGEDEKVYEKVKYGDSSTKEIKMIPNENYEIIGITVNGEEYNFVANEDGSYTMPAFTNVTENKHVVVTYSLKNNKIIINKVDKDTQEKLSGATFKLDQIEERAEPENNAIIGELTDNGQEYTKVNTEEEISGKLGELTNNGTYYFVKNEDGTYTPTNSKTYQTANGGTAGIQNVTANSYIPIDLSDLSGQYVVVVNARCSSESADYGYATITEDVTAPTYSSTTGRFMYVSGTQSAKDYTSSILEGGKVYYLHLGYRKDGSADTNEDQIVINSIKLYTANTTIKLYNFTNENGKYESTNQGEDSTVSNSYIPIDLTNYTGKYNLTVNAEISSESNDYGYATVTETTTRATLYSGQRFIYISGTQSAKNYTTVLQGGKMYYLHLGYYKNASTSSGDDKFTVNSINISLNDSELYHTTVETNSEGQAITQIPFGKYAITEMQAPDGYWLNETSTIIEFSNKKDAIHEFTIEDEVKSKIKVHHYIKDTTIQVADDEILEGKVGEEYVTRPKTDLSKYKIEIDANEIPILPKDSVGIYKHDVTEVTYYYVEKEIPLIVHYYIEGSTMPVPLKNGGVANDVTRKGKIGEEYITSAIPEEELSDEYELVSEPGNASGIYADDEIIITYYYRVITKNVTIQKVEEDLITPLSGTKFRLEREGEKEYTELTSNGQNYEYVNQKKQKNFIPELISEGKVFDKVTVTDEVENTNLLNKLVSVGDYYFVEQNGKIIPTNGKTYQISQGNKDGKNGTIANSYIKIDLSNKEGKYAVVVNARISSESGYDYGYAIIDESELSPVYGTTQGRFMNIAGSKEDADYKKIVDGGKIYYLHLAYRKDNSGSISEDQIIINSIKLYNTAVEKKICDFEENNGIYIPNNLSIEETEANSYIPVDLRNNGGRYAIVVNAQSQISSINDYLYATINEYIDTPSSGGSYGRFMYITGKTDAKNYTAYVDGGKMYYLHVGYVNRENENATNDNIVQINSINLYNSKYLKFSMSKVGDSWESDNTGMANTISDSYVKIDLSNVGSAKLTVNAAVSSQKGSDIGYTVITESEDRPPYYTLKNGLIYISGEEESKDYEINLEGKKIYYVHMGYSKDSNTDSGLDKFIVNSIKVSDYVVNKELITDENGKINLTLPYGSYKLVETEALENYELMNDATEINITKEYDENNTITITNEKKTGTVTVHHYIEGTTTPVPLSDGSTATDETKIGNVGEMYASTARTDIAEGYELVSEPDNASGTYIDGNIDVIYYYKAIPASVLVHHYLEGTTTKLAEDVTFDGIVGDNYTTGIATVDNKYELVAIPANANGRMTKDQIEVIYYYRLKDTSVLVHHYKEGTSESLSADVTINGKVDDEYTTTVATDIPSKYELVAEPDNKNGTMTVEQTVVTYYYRLKETGVDVHYYKEETTEKVSEDIEITGRVDDEYTTTPAADVASKYELVGTPANATGTMTEDRITVIYYYRLKDTSVLVHHYLEGTTTSLSPDEIINGQVDDTYRTVESTDLLFGNYDLVEEPNNKTGMMTEDQIVVTYYYRLKDTSVLVHHYIKDTTTSISADVTINGRIDDAYTTTIANDIPEQYELVAEPDNKAGTMTKEQIEVTYYYQLKNYPYVVNYLEKGTNKILHEAKQGGELVYGSIVNSADEKIDIDGYKFDSYNHDILTIGTSNNVINIYYTKRNDLSYKVNYLEKDTNKVLHEQKVQNGATFEDEITAVNEVITINGYNYDSVDKAILKITTGENVINIYYTKRTDLSYKVNYLEKNTNKVLRAQKVQNGMTYEDEITSANEVITIDGYNYDSVDKERISIGTGENIINIYYTKRTDLSYKVNYLEKTTNKVLSTQKEQTGMTFEDEITSANEIITIEGYNYDSVDKDTLTIGTGENVINIYYTKRNDLSYTVNYLESVTNNVLHDPKTQNGMTFEDKINAEDEVIDIDGYNYDYPDKYELVIGTNENVINIYYSKVTGLSYTVNYLEKNTNETLFPSNNQGNMTFGDIVESADEIISIDGYNYDSVDKDTLTIGTGENVINIYYIKRNDLSYKVNYLEKDTNKVLSNQKIVNNMTFEDEVTSANEVIAIDGYNYDSVDKATMKIGTGENVINIYYTKRTDLSYTVNYLEKDTNKVLSAQKVQNGMTFEDEVTSANEVITIDGYNYDSVDKATLTIGTGENVINIYYTKRTDLTYKVNYLEKDTNKILSAQKVQTGMTFEDKITSANEVITIDGYNYDSVDKDTLKITTEENVINIYYTKRNDLSYKVNYLEKNTNKVLQEQKVVENMTFDDEITSAKEVITIDGYNYDSVDKDTLKITTGENIINIYYTKRNNLSYTVNYLEKTTNKVIHAPKVQNGMTFEDEITSADEIITINGYSYDSVDKGKLVITTGENAINIYYTKINGLAYTVNYLEKNTDKVLHAPKTTDNMTFENEVTSADEVIEIDGYNYDSVNKDTLVIGTGENVINIYYTKRNNLSYKVNYLEKNTDKVLHEQKVVENMTFEDEVTSANEVITIDGYNYDSVDKDTLIITTGENIINIYYTKRNDLSYKVNYLEKDTNKVIHDQKVVENVTFEDEITSSNEVITIYGYNYDSVDKNTLKITTGENVINIYYTKKDAKVTVHYYEENTTNKVSEDREIAGKVNDEYTTTIADDIASKYELVATPANATGTMTEDDIEVIYYFRKKATQVIVKHYEEGTTNKLSQDVMIDGRIDDPYTTVAATDVPIKYELSVTPANANGTMTEDTIEVIYYYRVKDAVLNIRYLEKNTNIELAQPEQQHGKVDEEYITGAKTIDGYTLVEHSGNERGKFEVDPLTVIYYYLYNTRATVQYIDKTTGQILEQSTTEGLEGDTFTTESKSFDNYILVEEPAQKTVKMTKDEIVLKYYYIHVSGGVIEKHIDMISGEILSNDTHQGNEGDAYNIPSKTFQGYDLVEDRLPANAQGTMTVNPIEVIYYYIYKTKVTAEYIDRTTGEKLTEDEVQTGHEKDAYVTERKTFDAYKLVEVPANADGEMTKEDITVTYNYVHTSGGVIVNHIDVNTNKQLKDETKQEGYEGDPYETHEENIPGYTLVKERYPANAQGTMTREETRVTYYYVKNTEINIKYIDKETGEEITEKTNIPGTEGKEYTTEAKEIPGYDLVEEPENKNGTMTSEPIDVIYYYRRPAKVIAKYIDQETNEEIAAEEKQEGHQNDEYATETKDIKYYKLVATPDNATGTMKVTVTKDENGKDIVEDTTYVTYYYRKLIFNLNIDKKISSIKVNGEESIINGDLGKVEVPRKEINTAQVEVKYIIKVTNDSELSGSANILEDIPTGMTMDANKNTGWDVKETTATRQTKELQPGESEEYEVVLDWTNGENNIGMKENTASIISTENEAGFTEKDTTDNEDKADIIVAVGTGGHTYVLIAGGMLLILISLACGVYAIKKRK